MLGIWIRTDWALLDPDSGARKLTKINKARLSAFQRDFCTYVGTSMFYDLLSVSNTRVPFIFHVKSQLFVTAKSEDDPVPR